MEVNEVYDNRTEMVKNLIRKGDLCIELGVAKGEFSQTILNVTECGKLISVDRWAGDRGHTSHEENNARYRLSCFGVRSEVIKASFDEYFKICPYMFDFVYIDGYAHTGQEEGKTLDDWWAKVLPGGILAGHDYHGRWMPTVKAVNMFVEKHGLTLNITKENKVGEWPSWYVLKTK